MTSFWKENKYTQEKENFSVAVEQLTIVCLYWEDFPYISVAMTGSDSIKHRSHAEMINGAALSAIENCFHTAMQNKVFRLFLLIPDMEINEVEQVRNKIAKLSFFSDHCDVFFELATESVKQLLPRWSYPGLNLYAQNQKISVLSICLNRKNQAELLGLVQSEP